MFKALQFHRITPELNFSGTWNTPQQFASFLAKAQRDGIKFVLPGAAKEGIVITFDDGDQTVYQHAFPLLCRYRVPALVFLVVGFIGGVSRWDIPSSRHRHLSWSEILEMKSTGVRFGSHGFSHRNLTRLNEDELDREIRKSKKILEDRLGPIDAISYPFNRSNQRIWSAARRAGYRWGFGGDGRHDLAIKKEAVYITDTNATLRVKIRERPRPWYWYERLKQNVINGFTIATMLNQELRKNFADKIIDR